MTAGPGPRSRAAERLYGAVLRACPRAFRGAYGEVMLQAFSDRCRAAARQGGRRALWGVCAAELGDLAATAVREHGDTLRALLRRPPRDQRRDLAMAARSETHPRLTPPGLWAALAATLLAFTAVLLASLNLYLLEDGSPYTAAAYGTSPLLRFSYDGVYLSALAAGVAVCAVAAAAVAEGEAAVLAAVAVLSVLVALGGFGGLLVRHPSTFLLLGLAFGALVLISTLAGRAVAARARRVCVPRAAALLGACAGVGVALLVNLALLVPHTVALNPVSHPLYMTALIAGTHLNSVLLAMALELLAGALLAAAL